MIKYEKRTKTFTFRKFFGDSAKDMYTLSLRLQLDENIWCCKVLKLKYLSHLTLAK